MALSPLKLRRLLHLAALLVAALLLPPATVGQTTAASLVGQGSAVATFAGGCFWCMEPPFDKLPGVLETTSGYTGGKKRNPTYEEVSAGGTGHTEAVQVRYDPTQVSYDRLLEVYWRNIDPTAARRTVGTGIEVGPVQKWK